MSVKNIRFISGENVICDLQEEKADTIIIRDAIVAMPIEDGSKIGFAPFAPLQDPDEPELTIKTAVVVYICNIAPNLEEQYNSMFNRIVTPTKKLIV